MGSAKIPEDVAKQAEDRERQLQPMLPELARIHAEPRGELPFQRTARIRRSKLETEIEELSRQNMALKLELSTSQNQLSVERKHVTQLRKRDIEQQARIDQLMSERHSADQIKMKFEACEREVRELRFIAMGKIVGC